jgi:putative nucleotidyltransferase with HDIG domain
VAHIAVGIAERLGFSPDDVVRLRRAALLHDIGKLGVSNRILDKAGPLDPVEVQLMRQHTRYTFEILKQVGQFRLFAATAAAHHERVDGSGYHLGLHGEELGTAARILAVADTAEAMMADRPYRSGLGLDETRARLRQLALRGQLCPTVTEAFTGWFEGLPGAAEAEAGAVRAA